MKKVNFIFLISFSYLFLVPFFASSANDGHCPYPESVQLVCRLEYQKIVFDHDLIQDWFPFGNSRCQLNSPVFSIPTPNVKWDNNLKSFHLEKRCDKYSYKIQFDQENMSQSSNIPPNYPALNGKLSLTLQEMISGDETTSNFTKTANRVFSTGDVFPSVSLPFKEDNTYEGIKQPPLEIRLHCSFLYNYNLRCVY